MEKPHRQSTLENWVDWLLHLHAQEIDLGLSRIAKVAEDMQLLRPAPTVITVAGTNGKGSSVAMLSAIYQAAGYQVGTYTSPHITHFNERIQINGVPVSDESIVEAFTEIEISRGETKLTYFEFSTLAALKVFTEYHLDVVILEVGLGGRLDAVNVVDADASLITAIDIDHVDWLGDDRNVIAVEKAGIMREGQLSVCSDPTVPKTLIDYASKLRVNLSVLQRDFDYTKIDANHWRFQFKKTAGHEVRQLKIPALKGAFQLQNASGVIALVESLQTLLPVSLDALNRGLHSSRHPGRLENKVIGSQNWLIDVAHNPQSASVLAEYLNSNELSDLVVIFSALDDKDMLPMIEQVAPYGKQWFLADLQVPRASHQEKLESMMVKAGVKSFFFKESIDSAVESVLQIEQAQVLVWGSFFTVAQTIQALENRGFKS